MTYRVMVVDDDVQTGLLTAEFIEAATRFSTVFTDDPVKAVQLLKENDIEVVVLDQIMPQMTGTELFAKLKLIDPDLRGILLSGLAMKQDIMQAMRGGFFDALEKPFSAEHLADVVKLAYTDRITAIASRIYGKPELIGERKGGFFGARPKMTLHLWAFEPLPSGEFWVESELALLVRLEAGQQRRVSFKDIREAEHADERVQSVTSGSAGKFSLTAPLKLDIGVTLQSKLESILQQRVQERQLHRQETVEEETLRLEMPKSNSDPIAREIRVAPIYKKMRAYISIQCTCCGIDRHETLDVPLRTDRYHTRYLNFMKDGKAKIVDLEDT